MFDTLCSEKVHTSPCETGGGWGPKGDAFRRFDLADVVPGNDFWAVRALAEVRSMNPDLDPIGLRTLSWRSSSPWSDRTLDIPRLWG